jgi:hypothetical protein
MYRKSVTDIVLMRLFDYLILSELISLVWQKCLLGLVSLGDSKLRTDSGKGIKGA